MFTSSQDPVLLGLLQRLMLLVAAVNFFDGCQTILTGVVEVSPRAREPARLLALGWLRLRLHARARSSCLG